MTATNKSVAYRIPYALKNEFEDLKIIAGSLVEDSFQQFFINATREKIINLKNKLQSGNTDKKSKK